MSNQLEVWRNHFKKMASGQVPYTRDFTIVTQGAQVGKGYSKDMQKWYPFLLHQL